MEDRIYTLKELLSAPGEGNTPSLHLSVSGVLKFFTYDHLPPSLQAVSKPVGDLAALMAQSLPSNAELTVGLRKLLEAKDAFVRAGLERGSDE